MEQLLSGFNPFAWVNLLQTNARESVIIICLNEKGQRMSNEQKAKQWVDSMVEAQNGGTKSQRSVRRTRAKRLEARRDRPLNLLGCFALIHAIRSMDSTKRSGMGAGRVTA